MDPTTVDNPWALGAVLAVLIYLAVKQRQATKHSKRAADSIEHEANPNSGSSMKDSLNRIESALGDLGGRVTTLEQAAEKRGSRRMWRR